jgi:hypothetical protein
MEDSSRRAYLTDPRSKTRGYAAMGNRARSDIATAKSPSDLGNYAHRHRLVVDPQQIVSATE